MQVAVDLSSGTLNCLAAVPAGSSTTVGFASLLKVVPVDPDAATPNACARDMRVCISRMRRAVDVHTRMRFPYGPWRPARTRAQYARMYFLYSSRARIRHMQTRMRYVVGPPGTSRSCASCSSPWAARLCTCARVMRTCISRMDRPFDACISRMDRPFDACVPECRYNKRAIEKIAGGKHIKLSGM